MIEEEIFYEGQTVLYEKSGLTSRVKIKIVHRDDTPNYYSIVFPDNSEKQTVSQYLTPMALSAHTPSHGLDIDISVWDAGRLKALQTQERQAGTGMDYRHFCDSLDELGRLSGEAQFLAGPITSADKLLLQPQQVLIVAVAGAGGAGSDVPKGRTVGFLKYGPKDLFFYNKKGKVQEFPRCPCLLDFYVLQTEQRRGCGLALFGAFLRQAEAEWERERETKEASRLCCVAAAGSASASAPASSSSSFGPHLIAYDRPSPKLLPFLKKHYGLGKPDLQPNKYTIFEGFPLAS